MTNKNTEQPEVAQNISEETPGTLLKRARENLGLSQQQVADRLHLRLNNIQDIESDTHQQTVSITFTKGYVRIYAKLVGLPSEPLLESFDRLHSNEKTPAKLQSFSQRVAKEAHDERWMMVTYLVGFLVVASVVIWWFQQSDTPIATRIDEFSTGVVEQVKNLSTDEAKKSQQQSDEIDPNSGQQPDLSFTDEAASEFDNARETVEDAIDKSVDTVSTTSNALAEDAKQAASQVASTIEQAAVSDGNTVQQYSNRAIEAANNIDLDDITPSASAAISNAREVVETVVQEAESVMTTISADGYELNADGTVDVVFTFKDDCWVSVKDANKETMAYGVKTKGRVMTVSGVPPVRVILGAPQNVEIDFGGQAVDMNAYEAGRSANFQLPVTGE